MTKLVDFSASHGDPPSKMGLLNLEKAKGDKQSANSAKLYIKLDKDPSGAPAAHFHRSIGDIRAEYHLLKNATKKDSIYYIGYHFSLGDVKQGNILWQWYTYFIPICFIDHADEKDLGRNTKQTTPKPEVQISPFISMLERERYTSVTSHLMKLTIKFFGRLTSLPIQVTASA